MSARRPPLFDGLLWFLWIMATAWGWILGRILFQNIYLVAGGVGVAVFQWLVVRSHVSKSWRWAAFTAAGWIAGSLLSIVLGHSQADFAAGLVVGAATGIAQWLILRREVRWAGWWIPFTIMGWSTGLSMALAALLAGVIAGAMTGIALVLLLRTRPHLQAVAGKEQGSNG